MNFRSSTLAALILAASTLTALADSKCMFEIWNGSKWTEVPFGDSGKKRITFRDKMYERNTDASMVNWAKAKGGPVQWISTQLEIPANERSLYAKASAKPDVFTHDDKTHLVITAVHRPEVSVLRAVIVEPDGENVSFRIAYGACIDEAEYKNLKR